MDIVDNVTEKIKEMFFQVFVKYLRRKPTNKHHSSPKFSPLLKSRNRLSVLASTWTLNLVIQEIGTINLVIFSLDFLSICLLLL